MSLSVEEIRRRLVEEFYEDEADIMAMSDTEVLKVWNALMKKRSRRSASSISGMKIKRIDILEVKSVERWEKGVIFEIRGIVDRVFDTIQYLGCPVHKSKVKEVNGEYYCPKCGSTVSPVTLRIYKFVVMDDTDDILVMSFPKFLDEVGEKERNITEGDYVAVYGYPQTWNGKKIFNAREFKVLMKAKRFGVPAVDEGSEERVMKQVKNEQGIENNAKDMAKETERSLEVEDDAFYEVVKTKLISFLRRKNQFRYSQLKFILGRVFDNPNEYIEKHFEIVEDEEGNEYYRLKDEWLKKLEEDGYL